MFHIALRIYYVNGFVGDFKEVKSHKAFLQLR